MMMLNEMRTGEIVVSGDGNYAASSNGQCLLHIRSRIQTTTSTQHQHPPLTSSTSTGGNNNASAGVVKKNLGGRPANDDVVKRTRSMNVYELSQDLLDKQIELLERKYGGHARANHAARVIQRAFRHYSMRRKFATITAMAKADQRRHSRRFHSEMVESAWTATAVTATELDSSMMEGDSGTRAEYVIRTNFAALYRELAETVEGARASTTNRTSPAATSSSCSSSSSSSTVTMASVASRQPTHHHHPNHCVNGGGERGHLHLHNHHHRHPHHPHHHNHHSHHSASASASSASFSSPAYHYQLVQQLSESQSQFHTHQHHSGTATPPPSIAGLGAGAAAAGTASSSYASCASSSLSSSSCSPAVIAAAAASTQLLGGGNNPIASPVSHVLYNDHNHNGGHSHGELRRSDSGKSSSSSGASVTAASNCSSSKRVPPEVPRRTSSSLSNGKSPLLTSAFSQDSPHPRQRSQTPCGLTQNLAYPGLLMVDTDQHLNRAARGRNGGGNLMTEHSTSEDSLENVVYSNSYWCEANGGGVAGGSNGGGSSNNINNLSTPQNHSSSHVHSSPVPFPPAQHDRLILNGSGPGTPVGSGSPAPPVTATAPATGSGSTPLNALSASQPTSAQAKVLESIRKRQYRVGLNLFNKKPERGVAYLTQKGFLDASPRAVAKFFITRKGVSKQMIGEYLGNLQNPFNMATLDFFIEELDFAGLEIDVALRRFQTYFRMPGEAQKIERLMEVFGQRYCQCNPQLAARLRNPDTVFILAFAIIMLNTDLHTPSIKADKRMKLEDFIKNLRGIDDGCNIDQDLLVGIYERVKSTEFKSGADHVTQVLKVQQSIVGKKPNLVLPHRRLVCYCRLYEVADAARRERPGLHQREVFLFNDILVVTKIFSKKKNAVTYSFRQSFQLAGLNVSYFESHHYPFGIRLSQRVDGRTLIMFNARNDHDRAKFCEDLREAILEMDEMEALRIEGELDKQRSASRISRTPNTPTTLCPSTVGVASAGATGAPVAGGRDKSDNRDSGVADMDHSGSVSTLEEACTPLVRRSNSNSGRSILNRNQEVGGGVVGSRPEMTLKRTTLSNSLLDIHDPTERYQRRGSVGSLDSGMSISFQSSTTNSTMSRDSSPKNLQHHASTTAAAAASAAAGAAAGISATSAGKTRGLQHQSSFLGNIFHKARERKNSRGSECAAAAAAVTASMTTPGKQPATSSSYPLPHCTDV